ncbi:MAG: ankyrin repeat domain-containing protein [Pyrinomonadaceae bacterium]
MRRLPALVLPLTLLITMAGCSKTPVAPGAANAPRTPDSNNNKSNEAARKEAESALFAAAQKGDLPTAKALLERGVNPNAKDAEGRTPLTEATYNQHADVVKLLLEKGADPTLKKNDGATAASFAESKGNKQIMELFEQSKSLVEAGSKGDNKKVKELLDKGVGPNVRWGDGRTALTEAAWNGHAETVKLLLESGADPKIKKLDGSDAASLAAGNGHKDIADMINKYAGAPTNTPSDSKVAGTATPTPTPKAAKE